MMNVERVDFSLPLTSVTVTFTLLIFHVFHVPKYDLRYVGCSNRWWSLEVMIHCNYSIKNTHGSGVYCEMCDRIGSMLQIMYGRF